MAIDYNDLVGTFGTTNKKEKYYVDSYEGLINDKHMYLIRFISTAKTKLVNRGQLTGKKVTSKGTRKSKVVKKNKKLEKHSNDIRGIGLVLLSLDASTEKTGYCVFNSTNLKEISTIKSASNDTNMRIRKMCNDIEGVIDKYEITQVVLEDIYFDKGKFITFKVLANLQGALVDLFIRKNVKYILVPATVWKSSMNTLSGRVESKQKAIDFVSKELGRKVLEDEAEAFLIGLYALQNRVNWLA